MTLASYDTPAPLAPSRADSDDALVDLWTRAKRNSAHTRATYRRAASRLLAFLAHLGKDLRQMTLEDLLDFADGGLAELSEGSQKTYLAAIKSLLTFGQKTGYLRFNVGAALELNKPKRTLAERILSEEQVLKMIALEPDAEKQLLLRILYATGGRVSEVCSLTWRDAAPNRGAGQLTLFGKGNKTRVVVLKKETWKSLIAARPQTAGPDTPIFATRTERPLTRARVHAIVKAAASRAGLPDGVSPHWLRHAHASHALDHGAPPSLVKETLGHADLRTTSEYAHARPETSSAQYLPV